MGFLDRLRGVRQETTQRVFSTTAKKNAPPTYVNDFILKESWMRDEAYCQAQIVQMSGYAWAITTGLANAVFEDGFRFVDPNDPEREILQDIKKELDRMECLKWFALSLGGERAHGHTWLYVGEEELTTDAALDTSPRIANLDVFTPEYATVTEWDDVGAPKTLSLKVLTHKGHEAEQYEIIPIPVKECVLVRTRPFDRSHEGLPVTGPVWNALVSLILIDHAITTYSMKMGLGALIMTTKGSISDADATAAKAAMEDLSVSRVGVIPGRAVEKLEYVGASGTAIDFPAYKETFLNEIAAGTKIPKSVLIGAAEGAITGAEVGPGLYGSLKQGEQTRFEPVIREVVRRMGVTDEYDIDWPVKIAVDEKEEAEIRALVAQAEIMEEEARIAKETNMRPQDVQVAVQNQDKNQNPAGMQ